MRDDFPDELIALLPNLRRFALSLCRRSDLADDLVQTTIERAFAARERYDPATRLEAWLFRILRNAWIDMTRRARTRGVQIDLDDAQDAATVDGTKLAEDRLMLGSVEQALDRLPEQQREVLMLVCVEGMSYAEAAEVLGIPTGTVMSRLSRGRIAISEMLGIK